MNNPMTQHLYMMDHFSRRSAYKEGEDFVQWQKRSRKKVWDLLGMDTFELCEENFEIEWTHDENDFVEYRIQFNTETKYRTRAHLLIPKGVREPIPVMICLEGHNMGMHVAMGRRKFSFEKVDEGDRDFAIQSIENGYAALVLEQRAFGECGGGENGPECVSPAMTALLLGRTLVGERVWDVMRAIDMLRKHFPQLDEHRTGLMGHSGGGTTTLYAAALDERIDAAMCICYFCGFKESIGELKHCTCNYVPGIMKYFDMGDIGGLVAPRPLLIVNGSDDHIFPIEASKREYGMLEKLYRVAGAEGKCAHVIGKGGHRAYKADSWPVFNRINGF